jgi:Type ISP C-terminal specificity domain
MTGRLINERLVRKAPESTDALLELLFDGLDWPRPANMEIEEIPLLDWSPDELHLDPDEVARLTKIQQLPPLTAKQPFGVFILSFDGGRLPVGAVRRVVNRLVRKKRARGKSAKSLWDMNDLIFFCQSSNGVGTLHVVAFRDTDNVPVMKVISWDTTATGNRVELIASQNLPALCWPDGGSLDADEWREQWTAAFTANYREGIKSSAALAAKMADVAKVVRDEVFSLYSVESKNGPLRQLFDEVKKSLRADLTPESFADMYAQTMVYGLLTARITHPEVFAADALNSVLKFENPFLDALYSSFRRKGDQAFDVDEFGLHDLAEVLARANMDQVLADFGASERKDDPVVFFYEEFLERYDPEQKKALGTYYTPIPVVRFMVRAVDEIIKTEFGLPLGVADQTTWGEYSKAHDIKIPSGLKAWDKVIRMIDPATGTGTFLLEWMRQAEANLRAAGKYSPKAMQSVVEQMDAFEISLSSYAVAHLKTSLELDPGLRAETHLGIRLTDTLAGKADEELRLFDEDLIALEGQLAEQVKFERRHSVVIGNPPYDRVDRKSAGGWIAHPPGGGRSLFDDIHEPAKQNTIFSHQASLFNLYVYFWRWAIWKSFEQLPEGPSVACFITASSFLDGPGFVGLRELMLSLGQHLYVVDLGGDNLGTRVDENVFAIQTPVCISILVRGVSTPDQVAGVSYARVTGSRQQKLATLDSRSLSSLVWSLVEAKQRQSLRPATGGRGWAMHPELINLFPMQMPGCMWNRTWPVGPSPTTLAKRWERLLSTTDVDDRAACFVTPKTGRNINTKVGDLPRLRDLPASADHLGIVRFAFRSFDRQWAFEDPRLAALERPALWASLSEHQIFLVTLATAALGDGAAATPSIHVPDKHYFNGRGGKDVIPLYRDADGTPNVDPRLPTVLKGLFKGDGHLMEPLSVEVLFAYCFGVLAGTDYTDRFRDELETPGPRIPLTRDRQLFDEMVAHGQELLWLQTFGERFRTKQRKALKPDSSIKWTKLPSRLPQDSKDFAYDPAEEVLKVADGVLAGIGQSVWDFEVSGMQIIKKWLGYRTAKGAGKAASSDSPLDKIRPTRWEPEWSEELREIVHVLTETERLAPRGIELLDRIMAGDLISADELPQPPEELRKPPSTAESGNLFDEDAS